MLAVSLVLVSLAGCDPGTSPAPTTRAAAVSSPEIERQLQVAFRLIQAGRFDEAQQPVNAVLAAHAEHPRGLLGQALIHHKQQQYAAARPFFARAEQAAPDDELIAYFYGYCLLYLGELDAAEQRLTRYVSAAPDEPDGRFALGVIRFEQGQLDEAADDIRRAIALADPRETRDLARYHCRLGDVLTALEQYEEARAVLEDGIQFDRTVAPCYYSLSQTYRRLGMDEEADEMLRRHALMTSLPE